MLVECKLHFSGFPSGHILSGRLHYPDGSVSQRVRCYYQYKDCSELWDVVGVKFEQHVMDMMVEGSEESLFQLSCTIDNVEHLVKLINVIKMYKSDDIFDYKGLPNDIGIEI